MQEIVTNFFCKIILYKTHSATNFVEIFYNFVENNYPRGDYLPIKILRKNGRKSIFLQIFLINLQGKSHVIWEKSHVVTPPLTETIN